MNINIPLTQGTRVSEKTKPVKRKYSEIPFYDAYIRIKKDEAHTSSFVLMYLNFYINTAALPGTQTDQVRLSRPLQLFFFSAYQISNRHGL